MRNEHAVSCWPDKARAYEYHAEKHFIRLLAYRMMERAAKHLFHNACIPHVSTHVTAVIKQLTIADCAAMVAGTLNIVSKCHPNDKGKRKMG